MNTIAALATAQGTAGLSVIRVSGNEALNISDKLFKGKNKISEMMSHTIQYGKIIDENNIIDTVTVSLFKEPNSYTGEDVVEISSHGGVVISSVILDMLYKAGARPAEPGEFTKRAFLNNKLDLLQAEAVADLIHSVSNTSANTAAKQLAGEFSKAVQNIKSKLLNICSLLEIELDFLDDNLEFTDKSEIGKMVDETISFCDHTLNSQKSSQILRSGYYVSIVGYPNSGKSTLFNTLLNKKRAIVSEVAGTTRDYIEDSFLVEGYPIKLVDTAGIRESDNFIEVEGIKLVEEVMLTSNLIIVLNDASISLNNSNELYMHIKELYEEKEVILVQNKFDKITIDNENDYIYISAKKSIAIDDLLNILKEKYQKSINKNETIILNQRHIDIISRALASLLNARNAINSGFENEIISIDIREAARVFGELTGETFSEEILNNIFSRFCIGK